MIESIFVLFHPVSGKGSTPLQAGPYSEVVIEPVGGAFELFVTVNGSRHREARSEGGRWALLDPQGVPMGFCGGVSISCTKKDFGRSAPSTGFYS